MGEACVRPGCSGGVIDADGYCSECGLAPLATAAVSSGPSGSFGSPRCGQPGCTGGIDADGYCDECGIAASSGANGSARTAGRDPRRPPVARLRRLLAHRLGPLDVRPLPFAPLHPDRHPRFGLGAQQQGQHHRQFGLPARRRPRHGPPGAPARPRLGRTGQPRGPRAEALLQQVRVAGGPREERRARPPRRLLHPVRHGVLVHPQAAPRRPGRRAVRGARLPGARRPRLDLPRGGPPGQRPLGGAQGPAGHRGRGRPGGGHRRAPLPGRGRPPEHRAHHQLRRAPRRLRLGRTATS